MANLEEKIGEAIVEVGKETVSDLVRIKNLYNKLNK